MRWKRQLSMMLTVVMTVVMGTPNFPGRQTNQVQAATAPVETNTYYNIINVSTGRFIDIPSSTDADGTLLHTWRLNGSVAEQYSFVPASTSGYYEIIPRCAATRALDNPSSSMSAGTQYQIYTQNHSDSQQFKLQSDGNGNYRIVNKKSGMALTDMFDSATSEDSVRQQTIAEDERQLWKIAKVPNDYTFTNPIKPDGADPWVVQAGSKYYLCYANGDKKIYIRPMDKLEGMRSAKDTLIYTAPDTGMYSKETWAPELHYVDGHWYVYYAADDGTNANHRMYVLEGGTNPDNPLDGSYTFKGKIYDASNDRWAIDGTVLKYNGQNYFVWSGWDVSNGNEQNLYIASMSNPWTLSSSRVCISKPTNSWEKTGSSSINEGPQILVNGSKVHIVYSAAGSWSDNYCLGCITCTDGNLLNPSSWTKSSSPVFKKTEHTFGVGHASFVKSKDGKEDWIVYHAAQYSGSKWSRNIRTQMFTWTDNGYPVFGEPVDQGVSLTRPSETYAAPVNTTSYYKIVNVGTGKSLDIPDKGDANGIKVQTYKNNDTIAQRFRFKHTGNGWYSIVPKCAETRAIDNPSSSKARGTEYQIYTQNGSAAQKFKFEHVGDGKYRIVNKASLFAMADTSELGGSYIAQRTLQNEDYQLWRLVPMDDESSYEPMNNVVVSTSDQWTSLGAWSYYFGNWNNSDGTYSGGSSADKFTLNISSNNKALWGIQVALDHQQVIAGRQYRYTVKVHSSASGSILSKEDISKEREKTTAIVVGDNTITDTFTATGSEAKILMELASGIDVGTTLKFTGFSLVDLTAQQDTTTAEPTTKEETTKEITTEEITTTPEETTKSSKITVDEDGIATSGKVRISGYQVSTYYEGSRVIASVDKEIDGKEIVDYGLVFGLKSYENVDTGIVNKDLVVGNDNPYVKTYASTDKDLNSPANDSTATTKNFIMTMKFGKKNARAYGANYKVRAYVVLEDGTYVYSKVGNYSVFKIAKVLYDNCLMNSQASHNYLLTQILRVVDAEYKEVEYDWGNTILKPTDM